jgi:hypothetical protein
MVRNTFALLVGLVFVTLNASASLIGDSVSSTHVYGNGTWQVDTVTVTADNSDLMGGVNSDTHYTIDVNTDSIYISHIDPGWNELNGYHAFTVFDLDDSTGLNLSAINVETNITNWSSDRLIFNDDQLWIQLAGDGLRSLGDGYIDLSLTFATVPIPAAVWLFGSALAGLGWLRRKQTV